MTVVISGGGIAGLATAHALRAAGLGSRILVVEPLIVARKPPRVVALWSNTLAAFDKLGLKNQVCPLHTHPKLVGGAKYMAGAGYRTQTGQWLVQPSKPLLPGGDPSVLFMKEEALLSVMRAPLHSLGIEVRHASVIGLAAADAPAKAAVTEKVVTVDASKADEGRLHSLHSQGQSYPDADAPRVRVALSDGSFVSADVVVGADGLDSTVRELTQAHADAKGGGVNGGPFPVLQPMRRGYEVYRGIAPVLLPPAHEGGSSNVSNGSIFCTADNEPASFQSWGVGCRFAAIPLAGSYAAWFATLARPKGAQWPASFRSGRSVIERSGWNENSYSSSHGYSHRDKSCPSGDGRKGACFDGGDSYGNATVGEAVRDHLKRVFEGWHAPVASLLEATSAEAFIWEDARALDARSTASAAPAAAAAVSSSGKAVDSDEAWTQRVLLVGDAAHACDPVLAQGTGIAIEDGLEIAALLANEQLSTSSSGTASSSRGQTLELPQWSASSVANVRETFQAQRLGRLRVVEVASDLSQLLGHGGFGVEFRGSSCKHSGETIRYSCGASTDEPSDGASASPISSPPPSSSSLQSKSGPSRAAGALCAGRDALIGLLPSMVKSIVFDASLKWSLGTSPSPLALLFDNRPWIPPEEVGAGKNNGLRGLDQDSKLKSNQQ